jgi:hypothetical protein
METVTKPTVRTRRLPARDALGRFVARPGAVSKAPYGGSLPSRDTRRRVRALPARDARGRFVSFPTTNAPSWYVFCADCYQIPGAGDVMAMPVSAPPAPSVQPLPRARLIRRRPPLMRREEAVTWLLLLLFVVVMGWYGLSLPTPHR